MVNIAQTVKAESIVTVLKALLSTRKGRNLLLKKFDELLYKKLIVENFKDRPLKVQEDKYYMLKAIAYSAFRNIDRGIFSKEVAFKMVDTLVKGALLKAGKEAEESLNHPKIG
jgi:hypothetical protein